MSGTFLFVHDMIINTSDRIVENLYILSFVLVKGAKNGAKLSVK